MLGGVSRRGGLLLFLPRQYNRINDLAVACAAAEVAREGFLRLGARGVGAPRIFAPGDRVTWLQGVFMVYGLGIREVVNVQTGAPGTRVDVRRGGPLMPGRAIRRPRRFVVRRPLLLFAFGNGQ